MATRTNAVTLTDTTDATDETTGALVAAGGAGIGDSLHSNNFSSPNIVTAERFNYHSNFLPNYYDEPTVEVINFSSANMESTCMGADGTIYWFDGTADRVVIYNPDTSLLTTFTKTGLDTRGGVCIHPPTGDIYFGAGGGNQIGKWNPSTDALTILATNPSGSNHLPLGPTWNPRTNTIYWTTTRNTADSVIKAIAYDIDVNAIDSTTYVGSGVSVSNHYKKHYTVAPNGKMYAAPLNQTNVTIIDPVAGTLDTTTISGLSGSLKWGAFTVAPDGYLYAPPQNTTSVLRLDPNTDAITTIITGITVLGSGVLQGHSKLILGLDGNMHSLCDDSLHFIMFMDSDPPTYTHFAKSGWTVGDSDGNLLCMHPNGTIYGIGSHANTIFKLGLRGPPMLPINTCCNPTVNYG